MRFNFQIFKMKLFSVVFALVITSILSAGAQTAVDYKIIKTFFIVSTADRDYIAVGPGFTYRTECK